jgi:polyribonucleotide nucleotidyltransferase
VDICSADKDSMEKALEWIKGICAVPEAGQVYHGKVVSILEFGAFIEILPGKEGLLHVSEIAWTKTEKVEDVLKVGDEVDVKLLEIDAKTGKMRLSMRALTEKPEGYVEPERRPRGGDRGPRKDSDRGPRRDGDRKGGERRDGERRNGDRGPSRRPGRNFGRKEEVPAPQADDYKEPVDELY